MTKKALIFILLFIAALAGGVTAQMSPPARDAYQVGGRTIYIPSPEGFVNGYPRIPQVAELVKASEDPQGRTLTFHLPRAIATKIIAGDNVRRAYFYATIATHNSMDNVDVTPEMFADFATTTERDLTRLIHEAMPQAEEESRRTRERMGKSTDIGLENPRNLGAFDKHPDVLSVMMMMSAIEGNRSIQMIAVRSYVVVKRRLLYINIYKDYSGDADIKFLQDFARKWTAEIVEANK